MKKLISLFSITLVLTVVASVKASAQTSIPAAGTTNVAPGVMCDLIGDILGALFGGSSSNNNTTTTTSGGANCAPGTPAANSTKLPINGGVVFLMAAGIVIGTTTVQRYKVKAVAVQK